MVFSDHLFPASPGLLGALAYGLGKGALQQGQALPGFACFLSCTQERDSRALGLGLLASVSLSDLRMGVSGQRG